MRRSLLLAIAALCASSGHAAELPCGGPTAAYTFRWRPPATRQDGAALSPGEIRHFAVYVQPTGGHATWSQEGLVPAWTGLPVPDAGVYSALVALNATADQYVVVTATDQSGQEGHASNELRVPASSSGVACPPPPAAPTLLELQARLEEIQRSVDALRLALAEFTP